MQWVTCLLHCNELPLRNNEKKIDGDIIRSRGFKGPIGRGLVDSEKFSLVKLKKIANDALSADLNKVSTVQKYMY